MSRPDRSAFAGARFEPGLHLLRAPGGSEAWVSCLGASLVALYVKDLDGALGNVVLGYPNLRSYVSGRRFFGATVGRYANRIARGRFRLGGRTIQLPCNDGLNHLHGGEAGLHKAWWSVVSATASTLHLRVESPDGAEGYPGALIADVTYALDDHGLRIELGATADRSTVCSLTHHSWFNLGSDPAGAALDHSLQIFADRFLPVDETLIPTGEFATVAGTPFDFREPTPIRSRLEHPHPQLARAGGYDHTFVIRRSGPGLEPAARLVDPGTGRSLTVRTTLPGLQFYSGQSLDGSDVGHEGVAYAKGAGICLEPQLFPDSPNRPDFPSALLRAGERFTAEIALDFAVDVAGAAR